MKLHCSTSNNKLQVSHIVVEPKMVTSKLPIIKQAIIDDFKKDQMKMLRSYKNWISIPLLRLMLADQSI